MSGHSHWATIKHKKGASDAKKGKVFSKLARYIVMAAKQGGGDPSMNIKLQYAIEKAKAANMPKDNIDRAIKKGTGELEGINYEEIIYEGYGPGGAALMLEILTDNKHRTSAEIRSILSDHGGSLGTTNCVSWMFERKGLITIAQNNISEDQLMNDILDAGADDMQLTGDTYDVTCPPTTLEAVKKALQSKKYTFKTGEIAMLPKSFVKVNEETGRKILNLLDALDEHEDVQNIYSNFELPETMVTEKG